ncbi:MAG: hypothetical protein ACE5LC_00525 [Candidatus Aminicenantales bacterium]
MRKSRKIGENPEFKVKFYSGYRKEETPRSIVVGEKEFRIKEVLERKRVRDVKTDKECEVFICLLEKDKVKIEKLSSGEWSLTFLDNEAGS